MGILSWIFGDPDSDSLREPVRAPEPTPREPGKRPPHIVLKPPRTKEGNWNLSVVAASGQTLYQNTQGYRDRTDAIRAADALIENPPTTYTVQGEEPAG